MKIDTLGVQAFVAIADGGSFRQAADTLHVTQTAITQRLRKLETFLGVALVERTTRRTTLTEIGRRFLPQARRLLNELSDALTEIRETGLSQRGDVTIACVPTVGVQYLPRILRAFSAHRPHDRVKILDHASASVLQAVLHREAEFGIGIAGDQHPELVNVPLTSDPYVLVCRDDHPLAKRRRIRWAALQPHPLIFAGEVSGNRGLLDGALKTSGVSLHSFYEVQRSSTALGLVAEALRRGRGAEARDPENAYPMIRTIELVEPAVSRTLVLVTRKRAQLSPAARALYDMIVEQATP